MATRGESHAAILAEYPHLQDEDIELARRLVAAGDPLSTRDEHAVDANRFRHRDANKPFVISEFDRWVGDNNIPETFEYSKGWWDYVELVRLFASRLVFGSYRQDPARFSCLIRDEWDVATLMLSILSILLL